MKHPWTKDMLMAELWIRSAQPHIQQPKYNACRMIIWLGRCSMDPTRLNIKLDPKRIRPLSQFIL